MQFVTITLILALSATTHAWIKPGFWLPLPGLATVSSVVVTTTGPTTTTLACPAGCCINLCMGAGAACGGAGVCTTGTFMAGMYLNTVGNAMCTAAACPTCTPVVSPDVACP